MKTFCVENLRHLCVFFYLNLEREKKNCNFRKIVFYISAKKNKKTNLRIKDFALLLLVQIIAYSPHKKLKKNKNFWKCKGTRFIRSLA